MPLDALTHLIHQFVLVILLVNVNKSCFVLKEKMSRYTGGGGGEGVAEMSPNVTLLFIRGFQGGCKVRNLYLLFWFDCTFFLGNCGSYTFAKDIRHKLTNFI
jgi:hypothetical protein